MTALFATASGLRTRWVRRSARRLASEARRGLEDVRVYDIQLAGLARFFVPPDLLSAGDCPTQTAFRTRTWNRRRDNDPALEVTL
jgi:hypothetical protein